MTKQIFKLILPFLILFSSSLLSQEDLTPGDTTGSFPPDTLCFEYEFYPGDTLVYDVVAFDSIIIEYGEPLLKSRYEKWLYVCDSVSKDNKFYLTIEMLDFFSKESQGDVIGQENKNSPWLGRRVQILMDSTGRRYDFKADTALGAISPGGSFNPYLLLGFGRTCHEINEMWYFEDSLAVVENGFPPPVVRNILLHQAKERKDTLGYSCIRTEYVNTGQGSTGINTRDARLEIISVFNGYGKLDMSSMLDVPVHHFSTLEQKLTFISPDGSKQPGWHYHNINYTLEKFVPGKKRPKPEPEAEDTGVQPMIQE